MLIVFAVVALWLTCRDQARRDGVSHSVWIPTIWLGILASRPLSTWLGAGGGENALEGSPLDALFYLVLIIASLFKLSQRQLTLGALVSGNRALLVFYAYLLISVTWADSPIVSAKRWFKDFGNVFVALVILTEMNPANALRAVLCRCGYILIPLSVIFIRFFPNWGRRYSAHSGEMEATGVTFQKNSLGIMVVICGLGLFWDWLERTRHRRPDARIISDSWPLAIVGMGIWLLYVSDSKTSIVCFAAGIIVLSASRLPLLRRRINALGVYALLGSMVFFCADRVLGVSAFIVDSLGRDMTLTGRTDVWREMLALNTDPLFGTGFCSIWSDPHYLSRLPDWVSSSAHNGYLEMYIDGGWICVSLLTITLAVTAFRINRMLNSEDNASLMLFTILVITLIGNLTESHFGRMSPLWFLFLTGSLYAAVASQPRSVHSIVELRPAS